MDVVNRRMRVSRLTIVKMGQERSGAVGVCDLGGQGLTFPWMAEKKVWNDADVASDLDEEERRAVSVDASRDPLESH